MTTVTRQEWQARPPRPMTPRNMSDIVAVVFHYADLVARSDLADEEAAMRAIQGYHMDHNGWSDIGYNVCGGMSGNVYEARNTDYVPAHCLGFNRPSVGYCFLTDGGISPAAGAAAVEVVKVTEYLLGRKLAVFGHREKVQTYCPDDVLMAWVESVRSPGGPLS